MAFFKYKYFHPTDSVRLSKLAFTARHAVEGAISGMHKSPHRGFSVEFSEHRNYTPGDEPRHLDWRAYARSNRYYIKLYEQETNLRATLVLDNSASMQFGGKLDYAKHLAACLAYLLAGQQDLAGLAAIDESVVVDLPPASSPAHLDRLFRELEMLPPGKGTDLPNQLHAMIERLHRRSMVIILSDFWVNPDELFKALQHLRYRKHQGILLHLLDPAELDLSGEAYNKQITLQDLETGEKLQVDPADLRPTYVQQMQKYLTDLRRGCNDTEVEYHALMVNEPYDRALVRLLSRRAR